MTTLSELKELCEKATPGPYFISADENAENWRIIQTSHITRDIWEIPRTKGDYEYFSKLTPETVLKLIETIEKLAEALEYMLDDGYLGTVEARDYFCRSALEWVKKKT